MKRPGYIARLLGLTLTTVGSMSWNAVPIHFSGKVAQAATNASLSSLPNPSAPRAVTNGRIAFVSARRDSTEIHTINPDGSNRIRLTFGNGDLDPAWSSDGTKIAFARTYNFCNRGDIFVMNADGGDLSRLAETGVNRHPTWSPDGAQIAFVRANGCTDYGQIVAMNADGSKQRTVDWGVSTQPAWSPDGSRLAVADSGNIFLINADGSERSVIARAQPGTYYSAPAWSPDGSRLAFLRESDCDDFDCYSYSIWTVNADGNIPMKLADSYAYGLNWSPDGTKIIFSNGGDLFLMNSDGTDITNITNSPDEREFFPSWQAFSINSCADSISALSQSFDFNGGTGSVEVTATGECNWATASNVGWINITSGSSRSGNGAVSYSVATNDSTAARAGILSVAGGNFIVVQSGVHVSITDISVEGKKLLVLGENFDPGAVILLNNEQQKTANDAHNPRSILIGKKTGKKIKPGDKLQVRNPNGSLSDEYEVAL